MKKQVHIVLFLLCLLTINSYAVNIPASGAAAANPCGTNITVYDNGGSGSNYSDNDDGYIVLNCSGAASINISGTYNTESGYDGFILYDGAGTSGAQLNSWSGSGSINYTGNCGQTLTIRFTSDYGVNYSGIALNVTYSGSCTNYTNLVNVPASGNNAVACGTNTILYDNGGPGSNYSDGDDGYTVLNCSGTGQISLCGVGNTENSYDYIYIYSGVGTGGTLLASYTGLGQKISYTGAVGQALTVRFTSDPWSFWWGSTTESGFYINVTYITQCCVPPTITSTTPASRCGTGTVVLGATASAGTINWYAAATGGASLGTGTSYTTPSIATTTTYYVDATGTCTTASRTPVTATVVPAVSITTQPVATSVISGLTAYFSVVATGASSYQWQYNGVNVANGTPANAVYTGATTANLTINGAIAPGLYNAGGGYRCVVTGNAPCGAVNSNAAALTVNPAGYCTPTITTCAGDFINEVSINTLDNSAAGTGCTGAVGFTYYTTPTTSLNRGSVYTCAIQEKGMTVGATYGLAVWVDLNANGSFADPGEFFLQSNAIPGNATTTFVRTVAISIPLTATLGATRMRVRFVRNVALTIAMSCGSVAPGETEDYLITITERVGNGYGVYSPDGSGIAGIKDCEIYALGGSSGVGCRLCTPADAGYISPLLSTYPVITADNVSCTNTSMTISTAQAGATWVNEVQSGSGTFSAGTNVTAASVTGTFNAIDRKTIRLTTSKSIRQDIILESFEAGGASIPPPAGWFTNAYPGAGVSAGVFNPHLGAVPLAGGGAWNAAYVFDYNTALAADAWLYTPGIAMTAGTQYWIGFWHAEFNGLWAENLQLKVGTAPTKVGQTIFIKDYSTAAHGTAWAYDKQSYTPGANGTKYFSFNCYSAPDKDWEQIDSVQVWSYTPTINYTDFVNIMMGPPSPGSVLGVTNVCPGSYNFSASAVGTPGYQYTWTVNTLSGNTPTIANSDSSSTSIFFPNNTAGNLNYTVTLQVKSECCGNLAPINYSVLVYPMPAVPTASAANPNPCPGSSVYLNATAPGNCTFNWYDDSIGGNLLGTSPNFLVNPVVVGSVSYYVEAVDVNGCISIPRKVVIVNGTPTPPPTVVNGSSCGASYISLSISGATIGYTYNWYSGSCNGTLQQSSTATAYIPYVTATTQYYVSAIAPGGCAASNCATATATIGIPANPLIWLGAVAGSSNWFNPANWTGGCLPTCADNVQIPKTTNNPNIGYSNAVAACQSIILGSGGGVPLPILTFTDDKAELDVCGDFTQRGGLASTSANHNEKVVFMGTSAQNYIKSSTATGNFTNVVINNTATVPLLTIKDSVGFLDLTVDSSFMFQRGIVATEGGKKLVINNNNPSTSLGGNSVSGYVFGRLTRKVANGRSYDFPMGGNPSTATAPNFPYELMSINFATVTAPYLTVSFENPANATGTGLSSASTFEQTTQYTYLIDNGGINTTTGYTGSLGGVWTVFTENASTDIYTNAASTVASYTMTLNGRNFDNGAAYGTYYSIMKRDPFCAQPWTLDGSYWISSGAAGSTISATRTGMSGFSQFALGHHVTPLPIELVAFDATCVNPNILLSWVTATEMNNQNFTLERSCDETLFQYEPIATLPGAGNSSTIKKYFYTDRDAPGNCYYRLSQTDYNGTTTQFAPISINCKENSDFNFVGALPNPADNELNILFTDTQNENVQLNITDMLGQPIMAKNIKSEPGLNKITLNLTDYSAGMYMVKLYNDKKSFVKKIVKNK